MGNRLDEREAATLATVWALMDQEIPAIAKPNGKVDVSGLTAKLYLEYVREAVERFGGEETETVTLYDIEKFDALVDIAEEEEIFAR